MSTTTQRLCHVDTCTHGCTAETGCQGHSWREQAPAFYREALQRLVEDAARDGLVLTAEQRSLTPWAMGNYETVVSVRPARVRAA
jgi:hypothetical protein